MSKNICEIIILQNTPHRLKQAWVKHADFNSIAIHDMERDGAMIIEF